MVTASKLRQDVYRLLDEVLETGEPLIIERRKQLLRIVPDRKPESRLEKLKRHDTLNVQPGEIVSIDWSSEWHPDDQ
jgi:PHD/YefM family antitoxin component YafN of YafNO toxin-antitoxin module